MSLSSGSDSREAAAGPAKREVLQALTEVRLPDGRSLLASGHVQDVLLECHGGAVHVVLLVDDVWEGAPPPSGLQELVARSLGGVPGIASVRVVPRPRPARAARPAPAAPRRDALREDALPPALQRAAFLAVASGKGGVGKSSVSVNLAVALSRVGLRVAILDCDIYGFSVPDLIGLDDPPSLDADRRVVPGRGRGVQVMSMDFFVSDNRAVIWRGPLLGKALRQLLHDTRWDEADVVVLDLPPGTGDVALDVYQGLPRAEVLVVTTPDPMAARVAVRAGAMARSLGHRVVGVVENMSYLDCPQCGSVIFPFGRGGGDAVAAALGTEVLARIPLVPVTRDALPRRVFPPSSPQGRAYAELAEGIRRQLALGADQPRPAGARAQSSTAPAPEVTTSNPGRESA